MSRGISRRSFLQSSFSAAAFSALPRLPYPKGRPPNILFQAIKAIGHAL
jgi:hypothetical protein